MSAEDEKKNATSTETNSVENQTQGLVDVDTIKIKLLFLCKNKKNYESAASYLVRRGWETIILGSVKEAFSTISAFKPDFVVLSVNLPTAKIQQLPTVIYNTFRCPVITFGEESDTKTMGLLQSTASNYKMPGAVSGPSAHRRLKQILQEIYRPETEATKLNVEQSVSTNEISVRTQKGKAQDAGAMIFTSEKKEAGPGYYIAKGEQHKEPGHGPNDKSPLNNQGEQSREQSIAPTPDLNKLAEIFSETAVNPNSKENPEGTPLKTGVTIVRTETASVSPNINNNQISAVEPKSYDQEKEAKNKISESTKFDSPEFKRALIQMAAESLVGSGAESTGARVGYTMTAVAAEINGETGYLITQYHGSRSEHDQFNLHLINRAKEHYAKLGVTCFIYDEINLPISKEEFGNTNENVLFSETLTSGTGEAIVKFIKAPEEKPTVEFVKKLNKYKVNPQELVENVNVGANLYLHLPKNEKFYLYLKENATLSERQKQKLIDTSTALYIEADEIKKYERTFARNRAIEKLLKFKRSEAA